MRIETAEDAIEAYTGQDAWKFADREAAWEWMFEAGRKSAMNTCYRLAMAASEPEKGGSFNDGKWAVADAIKSVASGGCDCTAKEAFGHLVQQKRDLEAECKRLRRLLDGAYETIRRQEVTPNVQGNRPAEAEGRSEPASSACRRSG